MIDITVAEALFQQVSDDFTVKVAHSVGEACKLVEVGFECVCEYDGAKIFRKRK